MFDIVSEINKMSTNLKISLKLITIHISREVVQISKIKRIVKQLFFYNKYQQCTANNLKSIEQNRTEQ